MSLSLVITNIIPGVSDDDTRVELAIAAVMTDSAPGPLSFGPDWDIDEAFYNPTKS
jgi:hypothetical protein